MYLIDTHAHLYAPEFDADRDAMMQRARSLGVRHFFLPAIDSQSVAAMYQMEADYPGEIHLMAGLHPCYVKENFEEELALVRQQLETRRFVAIGEIGIDLYWDKSTLPWQQQAFRQQIQLAKAYDLPIVIHSRESFDAIFEVLESEKHPRLRGIFHCFTGTKAQAERAIDFGMKLGIGGVATFKNGGVAPYLPEIDLRHLVLETDAPYLAPVPHRGKRNESAYLTLVVAKLAELFAMPVEEVAKITSANALEIFGMEPSVSEEVD